MAERTAARHDRRLTRSLFCPSGNHGGFRAGPSKGPEKLKVAPPSRRYQGIVLSDTKVQLLRSPSSRVIVLLGANHTYRLIGKVGRIVLKNIIDEMLDVYVFTVFPHILKGRRQEEHLSPQRIGRRFYVLRKAEKP